MSGAETWRVVRQALALLQQLQRGPANRATLMNAVQHVVPDAYRQETESGRDSSFDRDLWNLRHRLEVDIEWDAKDRAYHLRDLGPLFDLWLSSDELEALAFLIDTFDVAEGEAGEIARPLIEQIQSLLPDDQLRRLERQNATLRVDLGRLDEGEIAPAVWEQVRYAVKNRRVLRFQYMAPRHEKWEPRAHKVEPYEIKYHRGHFELRAYCLHWSNPDGWEKAHAGWFRYRLDRILPDDLQVLPDMLAPGQRSKRMIPIRYRISPRLARGGVSRHFEEMEIGQQEADGWVTVTGKTDNRFEAMRILLAYGEHCVALEPPELAEDMAAAARGMANLYDGNPEIDTRSSA